MTVSEEDGTGDDHPGRPFDLAILDGRDGRMDIGDAAQRMAAIVGPSVPLLLLALASQSTDGVQVNRVLHRELKGEGSMVGVLWAVRELTRRKRGPKPGIARPVAEQVVSAPLPTIELRRSRVPPKCQSKFSRR
jgi:hypothetical protein